MKQQLTIKTPRTFGIILIFNPFVSSARFLYPLKTSETLRFSDVFREQRKGALGTNNLMKQKADELLRDYSAIKQHVGYSSWLHPVTARMQEFRIFQTVFTSVR